MSEHHPPAKAGVSRKTPGIQTAYLFRFELDPALRERRTTSDYVADALRAAIYDGQFADGEEINQVDLAEYFKVSRVPIREALRRLQAEGLVSDAAHKRAFVIGLSLSEIVELIELRAVLEGFVVEKGGPRLKAEDLHRLERLCNEMDRIVTYDHEWVLRNWQFHRILYRPSGRKATIAIIEQQHLKVERYVRRAGRAERLRAAAAEHRDILAAVQDGDFRLARLRMEAHVLATGEEIRRYCVQQAEQAAPSALATSS